MMNIWKNEEGQGMVEYGLIIALVAIIVIAGISLLGKNIGMNSASFVPVIGTTYSVGAERLSFVQVLNADTGEEKKVGSTVDLDAGTVKFTDLTGYPAMVRLIGRVEV